MYQIKDWEKHFESSKSKTFHRCSHAYIPNKQDGDGLLFILSQPDGAAIYGCWQMLVMACSLQEADTKSLRQGYCTDTGRADGEPWTAAYLAMRWRRTEAEVQRMFDVTTSQPVNWVINHTVGGVQGECKHTLSSSEKALIRLSLDKALKQPSSPKAATGRRIEPDTVALLEELRPYEQDVRVFIRYRDEIKKPIRPASWQAMLKKMSAFGADLPAIIQQSIENGWQGLFELKNPRKSAYTGTAQAAAGMPGTPLTAEEKAAKAEYDAQKAQEGK